MENLIEKMVIGLIGKEATEEGIQKAYETNINKVFNCDEETEQKRLKMTIEEVGEEKAKLTLLASKISFKLHILQSLLILRDVSRIEEAIPFFISELRNIANQLEEGMSSNE